MPIEYTPFFVLLAAISLVCWFIIFVIAIRDSVAWGVACLFIWPLAFVYGLLNMEETKIPLLGLTVSSAIILIF